MTDKRTIGISNIESCGRVTERRDDPERVFRAWPRGATRWNVRHVWRRIRLPFRRRRWLRRNIAALAPYVKSPNPKREGSILALGDFSGGIGLSRAAIYELEHLREEHPGIEAIDIGSSGAEPLTRLAEDGPPIGRLYHLGAPDSYYRTFAALPPARVRDAYRIGLWVWETPIFPGDWRHALDAVHEIWTPSEYSRRAIARGSGDVPVIVRPHHVTLSSEIVPLDRKRYGLSENAFIGVAILDIITCPARKNPWAQIAAWQAAFGDDPGHRLLMKIRVGKHTRCVRRELEEMALATGNVHIFEADLSSAEIAGLQSGADVYLSLHRAEGYGLNIRECLEYGIPVVATDYSANAEYGPKYENYHPIPYRMTPYRDWTVHYADRDFEWAEADIDAACLSLRRIAAKWKSQRSEVVLSQEQRLTVQ